MIKLVKVDECSMRIDADRGILMEIYDRFSFKVPGYQFMPKYKMGIWDGSIHLFKSKTRLLYIGLLADVIEWAKDEDYELDIDPQLLNNRKVSPEQLDKFIDYLKIPENKTPRDYQRRAVLEALNERRAGFLSPTSSGKSLIIYIITRYLIEVEKKHVLIVVPTTNLVSQMASDFVEYNQGNELPIHGIMSGVDKSVKKEITISTWQSIVKMPVDWFDRFSCIIGDEAHLFKADSLIKILEHNRYANDRFAFTGTLTDSTTDKMQITALFGRFRQVTTTEKLMKDGQISKLSINALVLKYPDEDCKLVRANRKYQDEISFINSHDKRSAFLNKLVTGLKGNTLVLFKRVDTHGVQIYNALKEMVDENTEVYFISGKTATEDREKIRKLVDTIKDKRIIIVGSSGTMSTGTSMNKIYHVVFGSPSKSRVNTLQSIGRGLRLDGVTNEVTLWDIVDDFRIGTYVNFALKHFMARVKMYDSEKFKYTIKNFKL